MSDDEGVHALRDRTLTRRFLLASLSGLLVRPSIGRAEPATRPARIGYLGEGSPVRGEASVGALREGLRALGWVEGRNIVIESRWAEGRLARLTDLAAELVRLDVDLIVSAGRSGPLAVRHVTRTVPLVLVATDDPVANGLAASLARPGGNVTGLSLMAPELVGQQLRLLTQAVPGLARIGILWNARSLYPRLVMREAVTAAATLGVQLVSLEIRGPEDLERAFEAAMLKQVGALVVVEDPLIVRHRARVMAFTRQGRLPAIYGFRESVDAGGLMMYGADHRDLFRRSARYVDRILKGTPPGDLPIEPPVKFELVVNLGAARALGLTVPSSLLSRADHVIDP